MHSPPAASILARAVAVNLSAAMCSSGTFNRRLSSVIVPTTQIVLSLYAFWALSVETLLATREMDIGGRLMRDMNRRRRTTLLKLESVRPVPFVKMCRYRASIMVEQRTSKEAVEFYEKFEIHIVALGRSSVAVPDVVSIYVDTWVYVSMYDI